MLRLIGKKIFTILCRFFCLSKPVELVCCLLQVWLGSLLLCDYILDQGEMLQDKTVVDLGAGTGITSIVASLFAKCVYCTGNTLF